MCWFQKIEAELREGYEQGIMKNKYSKRRKGLKIVNEEQKSVFSQRFENQNI